MKPAPAQHLMAERTGASDVEVEGSHAVYVSKPKAAAALIDVGFSPRDAEKLFVAF